MVSCKWGETGAINRQVPTQTLGCDLSKTTSPRMSHAARTLVHWGRYKSLLASLEASLLYRTSPTDLNWLKLNLYALSLAPTPFARVL